MIEIISRYDRRSSIITNIGGYQFQNLTNCSIRFSNLDASIVVSLLCTLLQFFDLAMFVLVHFYIKTI